MHCIALSQTKKNDERDEGRKEGRKRKISSNGRYIRYKLVWMCIRVLVSE